MQKKTYIGILVICVLIIFFYFLLKPQMEVDVSTVERGSVLEFITEDGKTRLAKRYIISMPFEGRLLRTDLDVGDYVEEGQVLAKIDQYEIDQKLYGLKAQLDEISAQITGVDKTKPKQEDIKAAQLGMEASRLSLEKANKDLEIAQIDFETQKAEYERIYKLWEDKAISQSAYDEGDRLFKNAKEFLNQAQIQKKIAARALELNEAIYKRVLNSVDDNEYQREVYLAQRERIKTQINIVEDYLKKTQIKSPVGGPVIEKFVEDEQVLSSGAPILVMGDITSLEVEVDILSEEISGVRVGQEVEISGKALGGKRLQGKVKTIYPAGFKKISSLGIEQQRIKTLISFNNENIGIRPGVSVDVKIIVAKSHDTLRIPDKAVLKYFDNWAVWLFKDKRIYIKKLKTGLKNTEYIEILDGVKEGDVFVLSPTNELKSGMKIKPIFISANND